MFCSFPFCLLPASEVGRLVGSPRRRHFSFQKKKKSDSTKKVERWKEKKIDGSSLGNVTDAILLPAEKEEEEEAREERENE